MAGAYDITGPASYAAHFSAWDGTELAIVSPKAFPPGAPLDGTLDGATARLRLKVSRCRKRPDGQSYLVIGRPLDLRRETRESLDVLARVTPESARIERW